MNRETPTLRVNWTGHGYLNAAACRELGMPRGILIDSHDGAILIRPANDFDHWAYAIAKQGRLYCDGRNFCARAAMLRAGLVPESGSARYLLNRVTYAIGRPAFTTGPDREIAREVPA
jgi:hypothetical protein